MEEDVLRIDNLEIHKKDNSIIVSVNPNLYPLEVIYSAAYIFINRAFIIIEGNPKEEILIKLIPKDKTDLEILGREFNTELINYMSYMYRTIRNQSIREAMVMKALGIDAKIRSSQTTHQESTNHDSEKSSEVLDKET